jgi:hypothetical protein
VAPLRQHWKLTRGWEKAREFLKSKDNFIRGKAKSGGKYKKMAFSYRIRKKRGNVKNQTENWKRSKAKSGGKFKKMSFSYRVNPGSIPINDGNFLEDALTQVCLPMAAEALPPAVTTVRQAAQQQNSTSSTNTLYTCPQIDSTQRGPEDWLIYSTALRTKKS